MTIEGRAVPLARVIAVIVLGGGSLLLAWLALGIMLTGAKIVSWTAGDREAVKKILTHVFGPGRVAGEVATGVPDRGRDDAAESPDSSRRPG